MIRNLIVTGFLLLIFSQASLAETTEERAASHLQKASAAREQVEEAERELHESLETLFVRLNSAINAIQPKDFVGERIAIAELRKIVPRMRREAEAIVEAHKAYQYAAEQYGNELDRALPTVYEVARAFKQFAVSEPFHDLQTQYVLVAESFEAIAVKYQQKKQQVRPSIAAVSSNLAYVTRTALFLERLEKFLVVMPSDSPDTERFLKSLVSYVQSFEALREQLQNFHRATVGGSRPGSEQPKTTDPSERSTLAQQPHKAQAAIQFAILRNPKKATSNIAERHPQVAISENNLFGKVSDEEDALDLSGVNLSGLWTVGDGSDVLHFVQQGSNITVSLVRSPTLQHVYGRLRIQNHQIQVRQLRYHLRSGQTLDLGDFTWEIINGNRIRCTCPSFSKDAAGTYVVSGPPHQYTLRRR